jgi:hypothetical protein
MFCVSGADRCIKRENRKTEDDKIVKHEKEIIDQDISIIFDCLQIPESKGVCKNGRKSRRTGKLNRIYDKGE